MKHILKAEDFKDIFKNGKKTRGRTFSLHVKNRDKREELSVGAVISKKTAALAVTRNYIKRRIYAYFREHETFLTRTGKIVVRLEKNVNKLKKQALSKTITEELNSLTKKI